MPDAARRRLALLAVIGLAFALRVYSLDGQSLWRDEVDTLRFATRDLPQLARNLVRPGENGPFYFLALRPWLAAAGPAEFALRFPSALAGTLAVSAAYILVRRLAGETPALLTALLTATAPYLVWYGQEAKMYALLTALIPLSLWLALAAAQRGGLRWWVALYIVTSLAFYTHILAVLIIPVQAAWILLWPEAGGARRRWLVASVYLLALVLPYLPLLRWQAPYLLDAAGQAQSWPSLSRLLGALSVSFGQGVLAPRTPLQLLPALAALLAGVFLWRGGRRVVALLLIWLLLPVLLIAPVSLGLPVLAERYLIWVAPAFLALAALGVTVLAQLWRPLGAGLLGAILVVNLLGVAAQATQPIKVDFRSAAAFVAAHREPGDVLLFQIPYARYNFTYYDAMQGDVATSGCLPVAELWFADDCGSGAYAPAQPVDGPFTNAGIDGETLDAQMAAALADTSAVWLVATETALWDERDMTRAWLDAHGGVTDHADFTRVAVMRYNLAPQSEDGSTGQ